MKRFTLIELLIVIAVIGILLTLLLPSLSKARNKAKTVMCLSNLRQTSVLSMRYSKENNRAIVQAAYESATFYKSWFFYIQEMTEKDDDNEYRTFASKRNSSNLKASAADIAICPGYEDFTFIYNKGASQNQKPNFESGSNGDTSAHSGRYISYGLNAFLGGNQMQPNASTAGYPGNDGYTGSWYGGFKKRHVYLDEVEKAGDTMIFSEAWKKHVYSKFEDTYFNPIHDKKLTYARVDGSAALLPYSQISNNGANVGQNNFSTFEGWEIDFWGYYVSPKF